jgi:outer membrane protein assembly factor BamA
LRSDDSLCRRVTSRAAQARDLRACIRGTRAAVQTGVRSLLVVSLVACAPRVSHVVAPVRCTASPRVAGVASIDDRQTGPIATVAIAGLADPGVTERLHGSLRTEPGQLLEEAPLADDLRTLWRSGLIADARVEVVDHVVTFVVTPHPLIASVSIVGAPRDARELRRLVWLAGTPFDPARVQRTLEVARDTYRADGHIDASIELVRSGDGVCFEVSPGPRFIVDAIYIPGLPEGLDHAVGRALSTKPGAPLNQEVFERDLLVISSELWDRGYMNVKVATPKITRVKSLLEIEIRVEPGPVFHIGDAQLGGVMQGPVAGLVRGQLATRSRIVEIREQLEKRFGDGAQVVPLTKVDVEHGVIDVTFEVTWKKP